MDLNTISLETEMRLRAAELRRDLERCALVPPFSLRGSIASLAGGIRRISGRIERWAQGAGQVEPAYVAPNGGHEWHNS